jgi:hypothetical protein
LGKYNAQLIGVLGPFMIESGKTRAETLVVVCLSVVGLTVGLSVVAFSVGLTVVAFSVGLSVGGLSAAFTIGISNISFFGSFNNFLV